MVGCGIETVARRIGAVFVAIALLIGGFALPARAADAAAVSDANAVAVDLNVMTGTPMAASRVGSASLKDFAAANGQFAAPLSPDAAKAHADLIAALPRPTHRRTLDLQAGAEIGAAGAAAPLLRFIPRAFSRGFAPRSAPVVFGFPGLDALDSAIANGLDVNAPAAGYAIEPPDQGLCVGNGLVIEAVNLVMSAYTTGGARVMPPTPLYAIFGVPSTDFISDPKCIYDSPTNTFFMSLTDLGPNTQNLTGPSFLLVAAINATSLAVHSYAIPTTDDGSNGVKHPGCPCFGDQPLLGADQYGVYLSTNEFSFNSNDPNSNGAQIYAINKADLIAGASTAGVDFIPAAIPLAGNTAFSIQPAVATDGVFDTDNGGTEFLVSALDFSGAGDNRIAVWALTDTCAIPATTVSTCIGIVGLTTPPPVIRMGAYADPPPAAQKAGPIPYGDAVGNSLEQIDTGDDRMNQVVYAGGKLYGGLNTGVIVGGRLHAGIRTFRVIPNFRRYRTRFGVVQKFTARPFGATLLAHATADVYYPSIGVTRDGRAVMAFSMSGADFYPSAAWVPLYRTGRPLINFAAAGAGPDDGFTGYPNVNSTGGDVGRWGDYTAATAVGNQIWMGAEFIGSACSPAIYASDPTCGRTRAPDANWDTFISEFVPTK